VTGRDRVFVDANELFPFSVMDLVLALAEELLIDFVWTDELLDEWELVIVSNGKRTPETARSVSEAVRQFFVSTRIDPATYRDRVDTIPGRDPDDRVHVAACAYGGRHDTAHPEPARLPRRLPRRARRDGLICG
jgi:hypothetical protein